LSLFFRDSRIFIAPTYTPGGVLNLSTNLVGFSSKLVYGGWGSEKMTTWKKILIKTLKENKERFKDIEYIFPEDLKLDKKFDPGFGGYEGEPFTVWTKNFVYFPVGYDGAEWVGSAPRNPCKVAMEHQGG